MFEPKIPALGASIGFVLSLLVGVFSGAPFLVVLLRAAGMGLLFGILVILSRISILRFIPELLSGSASDSENASNSGNAVDITIGEFDTEENVFEGQGSSLLKESVPDFLEKEGQSESGQLFPGSGQDEKGLQSSSKQNESSGEVQSPGQKNAEPKKENPRTVGGLDVLPDLQDFIPQVSAGNEEEVDDETAGSSSGGVNNSLFAASDDAGSSAEAETMVKAIRTILAKDS